MHTVRCSGCRGGGPCIPACTGQKRVCVAQHALGRGGASQHAMGRGVCPGWCLAGGCPPVNRMTDRHPWKHYLAATSLRTVTINYNVYLLKSLCFYGHFSHFTATLQMTLRHHWLNVRHWTVTVAVMLHALTPCTHVLSKSPFSCRLLIMLNAIVLLARDIRKINQCYWQKKTWLWREMWTRLKAAQISFYLPCMALSKEDGERIGRGGGGGHWFNIR